MTDHIVILGAGTGGTLVANRLRRRLDPSRAKITVVDRDNSHVYQPGLLFVPFGLVGAEEIVRPRQRQLRRDIDFLRSGVDRIELDKDTVHLTNGEQLCYDALVIATGARLAPEETDGLTESGWMERVFTFYTLEGASALEGALSRFDSGRIVVNVVELPIKCPGAPLEFCLLADWYFRERKIRDRVSLTLVAPLSGALGQPVASKRLAGLLEEKGIELVTEFSTSAVDGQRGRLVSNDGCEVPFDLAVVVPLHNGAAYVGRSEGLGDELDFIPADPRTLRSDARDNVFVIGDAAKVPVSKAGSVTHFEGDVVAENVVRQLSGRPLDRSFDGGTTCFIESGFNRALLVDLNHDSEPPQGHYPSRIGIPLLEESRVNHFAKLMFQWFYWHMLLPGRDIGGLGPDWSRHSKEPVTRLRPARAGGAGAP